MKLMVLGPAPLKIATNADTTVAYTESQISLKVWDSEEKLAFLSRLPLRRHIARLGTFSVDPDISMQALIIHMQL